ncbi:capsular polysaccharide synthesis protein-domain-containing protein [Xylariomycetidae sp. FL0641]|nr:capsular polysaccharide synthesis protein-domain-containing protein [Xylariomycetidae sp. FL0641]
MPSTVRNTSSPNSASAEPLAMDLPRGVSLIPTERLDPRSDAEIASWIQTRHPVTSQRNVWAFWHSGYSQMPPWVQRNVIGWVRRLGPEWTVHLLDRVPGSDTNVDHYLESSFFPDAFNNNTMDGPHVGPHQGDLIRLPLLWKYGGVWMDVGMLLFRHLDDICWKQIQDPQSPYEMAGFLIPLRPNEQVLQNAFIATKRGNPFIKRWHEIYVALWDGATNSHGFHKHPLVRHIPLVCPPTQDFNAPDMGVTMETMSDYLGAFLCYERLTKLIDPQDGFNGPEYLAKSMLFYSGIQELYYFQPITGWSGTRQLELLSAKREGDGVVKDETWHAADAFVKDALANTATMKLSHGPAGWFESHLADLWDSPEHHDKDNIEGTFAAYLRYGSVHFDQTREMVPIKLEVPEEDVLHLGYLEPKPE